MKFLAIVERTADGFRGYAPRLQFEAAHLGKGEWIEIAARIVLDGGGVRRHEELPAGMKMPIWNNDT